MAINTFSGGNPINSLQAAGKNAVINGGMDIWQRGTSITTGNYIYTADRWQTWNNTVYTVSRQVTGDTTNLPNIQYCLRFQRNSGSTSTTPTYLSQTMESANSIPYAGRAITFSFYARKGANYSEASSTLPFQLRQGTGTDQNVIAGFTGVSDVINSSATLTTTWQRFSYTATVSSSATELGFFFYMTGVGTAGANDYFEITGVQLELGTTATTFSRAGGTIANELAACQRYYSQSYDNGTAAGTATTTGAMQIIVPSAGTGSYYIPVRFPVQMRVAPTVTAYDNLGASGKVFKEAAGKTAVISNNAINGCAIGTEDATNARQLLFSWTASAEL
jgi:hypothetical protein